MELIDQHTKKIMEGCKVRAHDAGLRFEDETLEYIVTNRDLLELSPKMMIPTLYDYWVHDVEVLKEKGKYELYPGNPYETVINTRPAISFYNDNNPDWLNVMIFYHVLAHIDFFQNNLFYRHTWDYDFAGQALSDKRLISALRSEKGRWVDYTIEFTRSIDNLVGYHAELGRLSRPQPNSRARRLDYYFDVFLQSVLGVKTNEYIKEIERYNQCVRQYDELGDETFFAEVIQKHPEFEALYTKHAAQPDRRPIDLVDHLMKHSKFLNREDNRWMLTVMEVVRNTAIFFQPQIRTKIMNEGWASFWHEILFLQDDRIRGHEVDFARVNAGVTALPRVGLNPYALGMRLFYYVEEMAAKGRLSYAFDRLADARQREAFDAHSGNGREYIFRVREDFSDSMFINTFVNQDFVDRHRLFVAGKRMNPSKNVWEYFIKSRSAQEYRRMLNGFLYHPPHIEVDSDTSDSGELYLTHRFEGKPLVREFIANTMLGIEYLWGAPVHLETSEVVAGPGGHTPPGFIPAPPSPRKEVAPTKIKWQRVVYTMQERKLTKRVL